MYYIYELVNPITDTPFYVGKTVSPEQRLAAHVARAGSTGNLVSRYISIMKRGGVNPIMNVIDQSDSSDLIDELERMHINLYRLKFNILNEKLMPTIEHTHGEKQAQSKEVGKRKRIIKKILADCDSFLFRAEINLNSWPTINKQLRRIDSQYIRIPRQDDVLIVYSRMNPYKNKDLFVMVSTDFAEDELTKNDSLFTDGNRSGGGGWYVCPKRKKSIGQ